MEYISYNLGGEWNYLLFLKQIRILWLFLNLFSDLILLGDVETTILIRFFIVALGWERDYLARVGWGGI